MPGDKFTKSVAAKRLFPVASEIDLLQQTLPEISLTENKTGSAEATVKSIVAAVFTEGFGKTENEKPAFVSLFTTAKFE